MKTMTNTQTPKWSSQSTQKKVYELESKINKLTIEINDLHDMINQLKDRCCVLENNDNR
jgi:hypothetical protein